MIPDKSKFTFAISLSVLNHLGRSLYRSFATVLGEAISNAWDADSKNVWIFIDRDANTLVVKDDGVGMDEEEFQDKLLKIGYSKRKHGDRESADGRPFIGRKGIGKLALLSCAEKVSVISKKQGSEYCGGVIDNSKLEDAITEDLTPEKYPLEEWEASMFQTYTKDHEHGTIIHFEHLNEGIRNRLDYIKKLIALFFRFSLLDSKFNIHVNGEAVTIDDLDDLAKNTQFLWLINDIQDPYITEKLTKPPLLESPIQLRSDMGIKGFIASVNKPGSLKVTSTDERAGIDLFVNGRIRERDIMKHIPTARVAQSYLYGQIHYNDLDDETDRFTSSREGVVANDPKFEEFLKELQKQIIPHILEKWDKLRIENRKPGDQENDRITRKERTSRELYNAVSDEYIPPSSSSEKMKVDAWVDALSDDAQFNFASYAECFVSENLVREYIRSEAVEFTDEAKREVRTRRKNEAQHKDKGNLSIEIRRNNCDLAYLSMDYLANLFDKKDRITDASLSRDAQEYKPVRDAVMHTALLTDEAKDKLRSVYANIKARIINILRGS